MDRNLIGLDHRSLAAFRIAFGLTLLGNLWARTHGGRYVAHYTEEGVFPLDEAREMAFGLRFSIFDAFATPTAAQVGFALVLIVYLAYTFGLFTRLCQVLAAAIVVMLYHRNPLVDDGSDSAMRLFVIWTAFLPLGQRFSLDVHWRRIRPTRGQYLSLAVWGLVINLAISYFLNAFQKDAGRWGSGLAIRDVLWDPWIAGPLAVWGRTHLPDFAILAMTKGTLVVEYVLMVTVMLVPVSVNARRVTVVLMIALHGGIALFMNLGSFSFIFLSLPLLFIPTEDWDRLPLPRVGGRLREPRPQRWTTNLLAAGWSWYCLVFLALNYRMPKPVRAFGIWGRGPVLSRVHEAFMIPQHWLKFRDPSRAPSTVVLQVEDADGRVRDFVRDEQGQPFDLYRPLKESAHLGKYWVSWMLYMTFDQYQAYRQGLAEYLYRQGVKRFWMHQITVRVPDGPSATPAGMSHQLLFWGERPQIVNLSRRFLSSATGQYLDQGMRRYGKDWAHHDQLFLAFARPGDYAELTIPVARSCSARVTLGYTRAPDFGRFRLSLGDHEVVIDGYSSLGVSHHQTELFADVVQGPNPMRVEIVDQAPGASGYKIGLDHLTLRCLDSPPPPAMP